MCVNPFLKEMLHCDDEDERARGLWHSRGRCMLYPSPSQPWTRTYLRTQQWQTHPLSPLLHPPFHILPQLHSLSAVPSPSLVLPLFTPLIKCTARSTVLPTRGTRTNVDLAGTISLISPLTTMTATTRRRWWPRWIYSIAELNTGVCTIVFPHAFHGQMQVLCNTLSMTRQLQVGFLFLSSRTRTLTRWVLSWLCSRYNDVVAIILSMLWTLWEEGHHNGG